MSKSSNNHTDSALNKTLPDRFEDIPCVQYGFPQKGQVRAPKLRTIFEPIPDGAETASPVYVLTRDQYERQDNLKNGYAVKGYNMIATELQDKCEDDDRVLYPVHIESDAYHEEDPATLIEWFREFVENYLDVPFHSCTLYFSGNRSIHVHVPRFVSGEDQRERLRELAETFCTKKGADLDCGLYYAKRMFRLPGVEHAKTGLQKVEIEPEWNHDQIVRKSNEATLDVHESYEAVLHDVFTTQESLTVDTAQTTIDTHYDLFQVLDSERTVLQLESDERDIETPLIEQEQYPDNPADEIKWLQYSAKEFSPYAHAKENGRSVAVVRVKGGAYARDNVRNGATLVPAYFYGARGCAGETFTKTDEHAPLQLSARDFAKWTYETGDDVVIIGGQSRNSRVFPVKSQQVTEAGHTLSGDNGSRQAALSYLESEGYDVGAASTSRNVKPSTTTEPRRNTDHVPPVKTPSTEAGTLQQQAEQDGIETLSHHERWRVACRVLWFGWEPAWGWFREQFGSTFDPDITREQFRSVIDTFPDDYDHVKVPRQS